MMVSNKSNLAALVREDFPLLNQSNLEENKLIYLDHAATSQKPIQVIEALNKYYKSYNSNVHRGAHQLSALATEAFENSRKITAKYINAFSEKEIIFTRNATEAINLVAYSWGEANLRKDDEIIISIMEHHSNIIPWQLLAKRKGCLLKYIGITPEGELDIQDFKSKLNSKTRLVSLVHISNTLGCCNPIHEITNLSETVGAKVLLDACQSLAHQTIDIKSLKVDFLAGSSHKLCGPTGVGFLWAKQQILEEMPPFLGGGEMIEDVDLNFSTWANLPHKFEAGTPAIGEAIGMGEALTYLNNLGIEKIHEWEKTLTQYLFDGLGSINEIQILGPNPGLQPERGALATFRIKNIHSNDIAELLDLKNICIRSGHHCCQPLHKYLSINSTARASLSFTTTFEEINSFIKELNEVIFFLKQNS